jgi:hypothetical protein
MNLLKLDTIIFPNKLDRTIALLMFCAYITWIKVKTIFQDMKAKEKREKRKCTKMFINVLIA